jgi:hypothetical protein
VVVLASWLETRNQLEKRQEKNEFNFQFRRKNFLDGKNEARVSMKTECCVGKISCKPTAASRNRGGEQSSLPID